MEFSFIPHTYTQVVTLLSSQLSVSIDNEQPPGVSSFATVKCLLRSVIGSNVFLDLSACLSLTFIYSPHYTTPFALRRWM